MIKPTARNIESEVEKSKKGHLTKSKTASLNSSHLGSDCCNIYQDRVAVFIIFYCSCSYFFLWPFFLYRKIFPFENYILLISKLYVCFKIFMSF